MSITVSLRKTWKVFFVFLERRSCLSGGGRTGNNDTENIEQETQYVASNISLFCKKFMGVNLGSLFDKLTSLFKMNM